MLFRMAIHVEKCKYVERAKCKAHVLPTSILRFLIPGFLEDMVRACL